MIQEIWTWRASFSRTSIMRISRIRETPCSSTTIPLELTQLLQVFHHPWEARQDSLWPRTNSDRSLALGLSAVARPVLTGDQLNSTDPEFRPLPKSFIEDLIEHKESEGWLQGFGLKNELNGWKKSSECNNRKINNKLMQNMAHCAFKSRYLTKSK